jgi:hypothetical protein
MPLEQNRTGYGVEGAYGKGMRPVFVGISVGPKQGLRKNPLRERRILAMTIYVGQILGAPPEKA